MAYGFYLTKPEVKSCENSTNNLKNISQFMSKDLIAAAGFNVETPIVEAIIGNLMGTLPRKKHENGNIKCKICDCGFSSNTALSTHSKGLKHKKRLKALEIIAHLKDVRGEEVILGDSDNPNVFRCEICSRTVNSAQQLEIHLSGAKHKRKVFKTNVPNTVSNPFRKSLGFSKKAINTKPTASKRKKYELKEIFCDLCNVFVNSQTQYDEHIFSKRHLTKVSRTPQKSQLLVYMKS